MTTIQSTICGYSIDTLIAFLLGDATKQTKASILEDANENRELTAFIGYLQRLLEAYDYDAERVTTIAEQQMRRLVNELQQFNEELEADIIAQKASIYTAEEALFFIKDTVNDQALAQEAPVFSFRISAHTNRLPPTDPLSIVGLNDAKSPLHRLTEAISYELARHPLDEKGLEHFLTVCHNQLKGRRDPSNRSNFQKPSFWSNVKSLFTAA